MLLGGLTVGALTGCAPTAPSARVTPEAYLANDDRIPGTNSLFYYHAPFGTFFSLPYNHFDATRKQYFYGGQWGSVPYQSIVNISMPTPEAVRMAEAMRTNHTSSGVIPRSGFGSSSGSRFVPS